MEILKRFQVWAILAIIFFLVQPEPALARIGVNISASAGSNYRSGQAGVNVGLDQAEEWDARLGGSRMTSGEGDDFQWADQFSLGLGYAPSVWQFNVQGIYNLNDQDVKSGGADLSLNYTWQQTASGAEEQQKEILNIGLGWGIINYTADLPTVISTRRNQTQSKRSVLLKQNHPSLNLELPLFSQSLVLSGEAGTYIYSADPQEMAQYVSHFPANVATQLNSLSTGLLEREWQTALAYYVTEKIKLTASYGRQKYVVSQDWSSTAEGAWDWRVAGPLSISFSWSRSWPGEKTDVITLGTRLRF